jgi:hypothetical protein
MRVDHQHPEISQLFVPRRRQFEPVADLIHPR